ncbi:pancreatic triacylglycerol lipase-like [Scaptodrosophila lebanonensis]|uniref:Pancreatic triacylglycerol lipase-like n=1 Tax=Drosophila lebanonensis TaxID=7225 RepID=A0A6J2U940_DROLE|nr:pancreatic triacylglycerol lipase-like [Scaptodrosophila lebanonensis]
MRVALFVIVAHVYCAATNPIVGLFDPACFVVRGDCPNKNITFWLYSNETRDSPVLLNPLDLNPWDFQPPRPLKILIHGYTGYRDFAPSSTIRPALLDHEDVYVISIDYGPLVRDPCYVQAVQNVPLVSKCLAQFIDNLLDRGIIQSDQLHIIGFSLGGQVAGQTANYVKRKLQRITGLDPAKPLFILGSNKRRLDPSDADFVDVIHTDVLGRGMLRTMGHADFYPNFGPAQPGCLEENPNDPGSCNHDRAPRFYAESIYSKKGFWGRKCANWFVHVLGLCPGDAAEALMGYHVPLDVRGAYFLKTGSKSPYALGHAPKTNNSKFLSQLSLDSKQNEIDRDYEPQLHRTLLKLRPFEDDVLDEKLENLSL